MAGNSVSIVVKAKDEASGEIGKVTSKVEGLGSKLASVGQIAAGFLAANVIGAGFSKLSGFIGDSVAAAANLEQSIGGVESVFGDASAAIFKFGDTAAQQVGLSKNSFNELASATGAFLKNYGFNADAAGDKTIELTQRAADMAATFGGSVDEAMTAITAALRGQADPIERYGVAVNAAKVEMQALAMTGKESAAALTDQEKMAARLALIFDQTASSAGQFGREADTAAGKSERLRAEQENLAAKMGEQLLPIQLKITEAKAAFVGLLADKVIPAVTAVASVFDTFIKYLRFTWQEGDALNDWASNMPAPLKGITLAIGDLVVFIKEDLIPAFQAVVAEVRPRLEELAAIAQEQFAKFQVYYETDIKPAMDNIVAAAQWVVEQFKKYWPEIETVVKPILQQLALMVETAVTSIKLALGIIIDLLGGDFSGAWNKTKELIDVVTTYWKDTIANAAELIRGLFGLFKSVGQDLIFAIRDGAQEWLTSTVLPWFASIPGKLVDAIKEGLSDLYNAGADLMKEFVKGMLSVNIPSPLDIAKGIGGAISGAAGSVLGGGGSGQIVTEYANGDAYPGAYIGTPQVNVSIYGPSAAQLGADLAVESRMVIR